MSLIFVYYGDEQIGVLYHGPMLFTTVKTFRGQAHRDKNFFNLFRMKDAVKIYKMFVLEIIDFTSAIYKF
jgi:hypothetical protein